MRIGAQRVLRGFARRLTLLLLACAALLLAGRVDGAGVAAGILAAMALVVHVTAFGVAAALAAISPAVLRVTAVAGLAVAAGAGVWAAREQAFDFMLVRVGDVTLSPGGALLHVAAALVVAGAGAFVFLTIAGRAGVLGDPP